ncbi:NUMOD3 domain-containing DNA-binding protein [Neobacillus drentensis]|uniref:NUMOD3 domain-containing DNA-binding protein n=1 Tax=Neobacillus drentensis TaxID=220684 RepID=UPI002FFF82BF
MKESNNSYRLKDRGKFTGIIYVLTNLKNGMQYVGQTTQPLDVRLKWHESDSRRKGNQKFLIHQAINKIGLENFNCEVLEHVIGNNHLDRKRRLNELEQKYIKQLNSKTPVGYNATNGGTGTLGLKHSDESIEKWRAKFKGRFLGINNPLYGKNLSEEHRAKISQNRAGKYKGEKNHNFGKPLSSEVRQKISEKNKKLLSGKNNPFYGKEHSEESKKKISQSKIGKIAGEMHPMFGKKHTNKTKQKISMSKKGKNIGENNPFYGKKHSKESKMIMSMKQKELLKDPGWITKLRKANKSRISVSMIDTNTNEIVVTFDSLRYASNWIGQNTNYSGDKSVIRRALDSKSNKAYGFVWKRFE